MSIKTHYALNQSNETDNGQMSQLNALGPSCSMFMPIDDNACVWIDCGAVSGGAFVPGSTVTWNAGGDSGTLMGIEGSGSTGLVLQNPSGAITNGDVVTDGTASSTCSGTSFPAYHDIAVPRGITTVGEMAYGSLYISADSDADAYEVYGTKIGLGATDNFFLYVVAGRVTGGAGSVCELVQGSNSISIATAAATHVTSGETISTSAISSPNHDGDGTQVAFGVLVNRDAGLMTFWGNDQESSVDISAASSWSGADLILNMVLNTQYKILGLETYAAGATIPTDHKTFLQELLVNAESNVEGVRLAPRRHITV